MPARKKKRATYEDLVALPDNAIGELIDGELQVSPRPSSLHALAATRLARIPVESGGGGHPGGWWVVLEPELHLGPDVLVPDLEPAGSRRVPSLRARMPRSGAEADAKPTCFPQTRS